MLDNRLGVLHSEFPDADLPNQNLWQFLYPRLKKWKELTAFVTSNTDESVTYEALLEGSLCWAKELKKFFNGSQPPTVFVIMQNCLEYLMLTTGCYAVGAPMCTIKHDTNKDLIYLMVSETKPSLVVTESSLYKIFKEIIDQTGISPQIYTKGPSVVDTKNLMDIIYSGDALDASEAGKYDPAMTASIAYSSGTTGNPKGIILSHRSQTNIMTAFTQSSVFPLRPADEAGQETLVGNLPFAHVFGCQYYCIAALHFGCRVVDFDYTNEETLLQHIKKYKPKLLILRSYMMEALSKTDCADEIKSLRTIMCTGSPPNCEAFSVINQKAGNTLLFQDCYGASEVGVMTITPINQLRLGMSGKLIPNSKIKFVDRQTGHTITEPLKLGELWFQGPGMMDGYLNNPKATQEAIDEDNWYHTGDIGYFDEDYFIKVIDRAKDFITVGDKQVSPSEIELLIKEHPSVVDVGVVGIADVTTGREVPKAFVIRKGNVEDKEIIEFVEERAAKEMRLTGGITFVNELPRNHLGKLVRKFLREMEWYK